MKTTLCKMIVAKYQGCTDPAQPAGHSLFLAQPGMAKSVKRLFFNTFMPDILHGGQTPLPPLYTRPMQDEIVLHEGQRADPPPPRCKSKTQFGSCAIALG